MAFGENAADLRNRLPPVPGRKWAVTKVLQVVLAMSMDLEQRVEEADDDTLLACEIVYRGRIQRHRTVDAGLFSSLTLCALPQVGQALATAASERGVPVVAAEPYEHVSSNERVLRVRRQRAALAAQVHELESAEDAPA